MRAQIRCEHKGRAETGKMAMAADKIAARDRRGMIGKVLGLRKIYGSALMPLGLRVFNLAIQKDSRLRMMFSRWLRMVSIPMREILEIEWPGELKWSTMGSFFFRFFISDLVFVNRVYSSVVVLPTYCKLHFVHVMR